MIQYIKLLLLQILKTLKGVKYFISLIINWLEAKRFNIFNEQKLQVYITDL